MKKPSLKLFIFIAFLFVLFPPQVYAYLDPGTGSYIFQILIAGLLGSLFFLKSAFKKIKSFYKDTFLKKPAETDENN